MASSSDRIAPYLSTTSKSISFSLSSQSSGGGDDRVPLPKQWTLVKECYMERREPWETWRSSVKHQIANLGRKLNQSLVEFTDLNSIMPPEAGDAQTMASAGDDNNNSASTEEVKS
ncbi:uncharacterized protein [Ptychodera flava]|uniref:uncharacterized protein n=1 Tax=Ptychodera flava TaxID=63121 RepID=UPI00396A990F